MKRNDVIKLASGAMLAALYVVFSNLLTVNLGLFKISMESLPVIFAGFLFGRREGLLVGTVGSFAAQATGAYGLSVTTPLWMLPYAAAGWAAGWYCTRDFLPGSRFRILLLTFLCQFLITSLNLTATVADAYVFGYPSGLTTVIVLVRFVNSVLRTILFAFFTEAVMRLLKRSVRLSADSPESKEKSF